jgi:tRNA(fMet)-specific endonuclease VapC
MATERLYLLNTNIVVHFIRDSPLWMRIRGTYSLLTAVPTPNLSVVSAGELRSLSMQWGWGTRKLDQLEFALGFFRVRSIDDPEILELYAAIDSFRESLGRKMGKNDVWIAATAAVTGATLLTTDRDFDHLAPRFLNRDGIDPDTK